MEVVNFVKDASDAFMSDFCSFLALVGGWSTGVVRMFHCFHEIQGIITT